MKRILIAIILIMSLLLCFIACNKDTGDGDESDTSDTVESSEVESSDAETSDTESETESEDENTEPPVDTNAVLVDKINALIANKPANVALKITTTTGGLSLNAEYTVADTAVTYKVEKYNTLPDLYGDYDVNKSTLEGSAVIADGVVTEIDGETVEIPEFDTLTGKFTFALSNLTNIQDSFGVFSADVKTPATFLGIAETDATNVKVSVTYTNTAIAAMTVTYKTPASSSVTLAYTFG